VDVFLKHGVHMKKEKKQEKVAIAMHCNLRPPDIAPVVLTVILISPLEQLQSFFSHVQMFWRLMGICQYFGHIFTAHAQKLLLPSFRSKFWYWH